MDYDTRLHTTHRWGSVHSTLSPLSSSSLVSGGIREPLSDVLSSSRSLDKNPPVGG